MPKCSICGKNIKKPNSKRHINSQFHQNALKNQTHLLIEKKVPIKESKKSKAKKIEVTQEIKYITQDKFEEIVSRIKDLEVRLSVLEKGLDKQKVDKRKHVVSEISDEQFFELVTHAYHKIEKKLGDMVTIPSLTSKIKESLKWDTDEIHERLYHLYLNYKID